MIKERKERRTESYTPLAISPVFACNISSLPAFVNLLLIGSWLVSPPEMDFTIILHIVQGCMG